MPVPRNTVSHWNLFLQLCCINILIFATLLHLYVLNYFEMLLTTYYLYFSIVIKMKIKKLVLLAIRGNTELRRKIMAALGVSHPTMQKYLNENSEQLTLAASLREIRESFELTDEDILEETEPETIKS